MVDCGEFGFGGKEDAGIAEASEVVLADTTTFMELENVLDCSHYLPSPLLTVVSLLCKINGYLSPNAPGGAYD